LWQAKEPNGIAVISHSTAPETEGKHRKSHDKVELHAQIFNHLFKKRKKQTTSEGGITVWE